MPTSEAPAEVNEPKGPSDGSPQTGSAAQETSITGSILGLDTFSASDLEPGKVASRDESAPLELRDEDAPSLKTRGSRWLDYDTHELLEMISDLEDERRWARLREGIWIAILIHLVLLSAVTWIPKYVFKVPPVIDPFDAIKQRKDLSYLDLPPDLLKKLQPKVQVKPVPEKRPQIDKKTLEAMNKPTPPPLPEPTTPPKIENPAQPQPTLAPPPPKTESPVEA